MEKKIKLNLNKLNSLDKDKPYIFSIEVGSLDTQDTIKTITNIRDFFINDLGFKCVYFYPTRNNVAEVVFENLDNYILN